jgi:hypothetical protein
VDFISRGHSRIVAASFTLVRSLDIACMIMAMECAPLGFPGENAVAV